MTNSFDEKAGNEKKKESTSDQIRSLTGNDIFCPKCGAENYFESDKNNSLLDYFCKKCNVKLNVFWDTYHDGYMTAYCCEACKELTFNDQKFCISCGLTKAIIKRQDEIMSGDYKPRRHKLFIAKDAETEWEKFMSGRNGKVTGVNPKHPHARKIKIILIICFIMLIPLIIAAAILPYLGMRG